jgi:Transposase IS116/IS110/IS902 family
VAGIFRTHDDAAIITSLTGIGDVLGAEFLALVGGSLAGFASADHLAGYAGLAPAPHDSGYRTGNLHRPRRYNRQRQRVFYTSAMISIQRSPASKAYDDGNEPKASDTPRRSWPSPDDASTCSGLCSATTVATKNNRPHTRSPLDKPD